MGKDNHSEGNYTSVFGKGLEAQSYCSTIFGQYAEPTTGSSTTWSTNDPLFVIGNGTSNSNRSNAITILKNGNMGFGTSAPHAAIEIESGDVYLKDSSKGIILTNPNGFCYRVTVDNSGNLVSNSVACPQ